MEGLRKFLSCIKAVSWSPRLHMVGIDGELCNIPSALHDTFRHTQRDKLKTEGPALDYGKWREFQSAEREKQNSNFAVFDLLDSDSIYL